MSTFSSVVRKPGQKIAPKAAPRRNLQRNAPKSITPTTTLTPDSLAQSPGRQPIQEDNTPETNDVDNQNSASSLTVPPPPLNSYNQDVVAALTPPPTALDRASPTPSIQASNGDIVRQNSVEVRIPPVVRSLSRERSSGVPAVASSALESRLGLKRKTTDASQEEGNTQIESATEVDDSVSNKRRKTTPRPSATQPLPQPIVVSPQASAESALRLRRSNSRNDSQPPDALLQQATSSAATVSELANSIESRTRSLRSRSRQQSVQSGAGVEVEDDPTDGTFNDQSGGGKDSRRRAQSSVTADGPVTTPKKTKYRRGHTPENAQQHQIDTAGTTMGALTEDTGLGKRSEIGQRIDAEWPEIKKRWDQVIITNREAAKNKRKSHKLAGISDDVADQIAAVSDAIPVPQTAIVNGMIVLDPTSREVDFGTNLDRAVIEHQDAALEDEKIYRYVNSARIGKNAGLRRSSKWDEDNTDLFYKGLRMFGTDFEMISNMFPGFDRKQIKKKYVKEEKSNFTKVMENLAQQQRINLEEFAQMTNMEFQDPKEIENEIKAEEKRLREEDEKRRAQEGFINDDADTVLPSTEIDDANVDGELTEAAATDTEPVPARQGLGGSTAPPPKKRQRKPKEASKARTTKKGRKPLEGVEERIGPIDEVAL